MYAMSWISSQFTVCAHFSACNVHLYLFHAHITDGNGAWSTEGCTTNGRDSDGKVIGESNHLTSFAVLNVSFGVSHNTAEGN